MMSEYRCCRAVGSPQNNLVPRAEDISPHPIRNCFGIGERPSHLRAAGIFRHSEQVVWHTQLLYPAERNRTGWGIARGAAIAVPLHCHLGQSFRLAKWGSWPCLAIWLIEEEQNRLHSKLPPAILNWRQRQKCLVAGDLEGRQGWIKKKKNCDLSFFGCNGGNLNHTFLDGKPINWRRIYFLQVESWGI